MGRVPGRKVLEGSPDDRSWRIAGQYGVEGC